MSIKFIFILFQCLPHFDFLPLPVVNYSIAEDRTLTITCIAFKLIITPPICCSFSDFSTEDREAAERSRISFCSCKTAAALR